MALKYWYSDGSNAAWAAMDSGHCLNWWDAWDDQNNQPLADSQSASIPAAGESIIFAGPNPPTTGPAAPISFASVSDVYDSAFWYDGSITTNIRIAPGGSLTWTGGMGSSLWCGDASAEGVILNISGGTMGDSMGMYVARFGSNVTLNNATLYGATFGPNATLGGYCSIGADYGIGAGVTVSGPMAVKDSASVLGSLSTSAAGDVIFTESASIQSGSVSLASGIFHWKSQGQFTPLVYGSGVSALAFYAYRSLTVTAMASPICPMGSDVTVTINVVNDHGGGVITAIDLSKLPKTSGGVMSLATL